MCFAQNWLNKGATGQHTKNIQHTKKFPGGQSDSPRVGSFSLFLKLSKFSTLFNMGSMRTYSTLGHMAPLIFFLNYKALMEAIWHVVSPTLDLSKNTCLVLRALVKICWCQHFWHHISEISENWFVSEGKLMFLGTKLYNCTISLNILCSSEKTGFYLEISHNMCCALCTIMHIFR